MCRFQGFGGLQPQKDKKIVAMQDRCRPELAVIVPACYSYCFTIF